MGDISSVLEVIEKSQTSPSLASREELETAIDQIVRITGETYTRESGTYAQVRTGNRGKWDDELLRLVRKRVADGKLITNPSGKWLLLDVGAGYGRDVLRLSQEPDIEAIALERSAGFVEALRQLQESGKLSRDAVVVGDMRDMSAIADASFDCVRNHAALHHLPVVPYGLGADAAVAESRRVLKKGGMFHVLVKAGFGLKMIDTGEGLGDRFYQLFTPDLLCDLLVRHAFSVVHLEKGVEFRPAGQVDWLFCLAVAV